MAVQQETVKLEPTGGYFVSHNEIYRNPDISARAKGIHGDLRSNKESFEVNKTLLFKRHKEGRDAICRAFAELEEWGYITRKIYTEKLIDGKRVRRVDFTVHAMSRKAHKPLLKRYKRNPRRVQVKVSDTENPITENPITENPPQRSTTLPELLHVDNVEKGENLHSSDSAPNLEKQEGRGVPPASNLGRGAPAPSIEQDEGASDRPKKTRSEKPCRSAAKTPTYAPWAGKSYAGKTKDDLPEITHHTEISRYLAFYDPIEIAMAATGERLAGGYGFWIKWLNGIISHSVSLGIPKPYDAAIYSFLDELSFAFADSDSGTRSIAGVFNSRLNKCFKVAK